MYEYLWRALPGPWPVKALLSLILIAVVVVVCFLWVFPAVAQDLPFNDNSVKGALLLPGSVTSFT
jgi:hypothetical protein